MGARLTPHARFGLAVTAMVLAFSASFTTLAPGGRWQNRLFGQTMWQENDPGGWYLASAHELFWHPGSLLFAGHPGLPMQVLLAVLQNAAYVIGGGPWRSLSYTEFTARHISTIWWLSKLLATLAHLLSFYVLYKFARVAGLSRRAAILAMSAYATSLPVLYYVSRVSVEPWMVAFFLLTFMGLWRYQDTARGSARQRWTYLAWAAGAAVSGAFTKFLLLAPLPFIGVALLLVPSAAAATTPPAPWTVRWRAFAVYAGATAAAVLLYSLVMDWSEFVRLWVTQSELHQARQAAATGYRQALRSLMPGLSPFGLCELPFVAIGAAGLVWALLRRRASARLVWPALYALLTTVVWAYRSIGQDQPAFHYLFIVVAMLSIGVGCVGDRVIARSAWLAHREVGALVALVLLLHGVSLWAATDSRLDDAARYRTRHLALWYDALARLRQGERVLLVGRPYPRFHGIGVYSADARAGRSAALCQELEDLLLLRSQLSLADRSTERLRSMGVRYVLDSRTTPPTLLPLDEWHEPTRRLEHRRARGSARARAPQDPR